MTSTVTRDAKPKAADLQDILRPIRDDLELVKTRLVDLLQTPVAKQAVYLIAAGGKQLRPALVLLAGRSGDYERHREALIDLAVAAELIHTATLIHDDIIDQAALRRQQPTFHQRFGTERAVLMGDYLYSVAFARLARLKDPAVMAEMAQVCERLSVGEFQEVDSRFNVHLTEAQYLEIIRDKTASLIAICCRLGAHVAGAAPTVAERLGAFGINFGLAFQIMDDCLDLMGEEHIVGKTLRSDLDKGSLSLPVIYLSQTLSAHQRHDLFTPLERHDPDEAFLARVGALARESGAITKALDTARVYLQRATDSLTDHEDLTGLFETYRQLAQYARERVR